MKRRKSWKRFHWNFFKVKFLLFLSQVCHSVVSIGHLVSSLSNSLATMKVLNPSLFPNMVPIHQSEVGKVVGVKDWPNSGISVMLITVAGHLPHAPLLPSVLRPAPTCLARHLPLRPLPPLHRNPLCCHAAWSPQVNQDSTKRNRETFLPKISDVACLKSTAGQPWRSWGRWSRGRKWSRQNSFPADNNIAHPTFQSTSLVSVLILFRVFLVSYFVSYATYLAVSGSPKSWALKEITFNGDHVCKSRLWNILIPDEEQVKNSNYVFQLRPGIYIYYCKRYESWSPQPNKYCTSLSCGMNNEHWTRNTWAKWWIFRIGPFCWDLFQPLGGIIIWRSFSWIRNYFS